MQKLRTNIDVADSKLLEIIGNRMKVAEQIGLLKKTKNVAVLQNQRWNEILEKMVQEGKEKGLSEDDLVADFQEFRKMSKCY
jgi:chorismate mutase